MKKRWFGVLILIFALVVIGNGLPMLALAQDEDKGIIISDLDWSPDGSQLAIGIGAQRNRAECVADPNIELLNVVSRQMTSIPQPDSTCSATTADFSSDGSQLLTTSDSYLEIWNVTTREHYQGLIMEGARFRRAFWRPNTTFFLDFEGYGVDIRDAAHLDKSYAGMISPGRLENIVFTDSAWSPDGKRIASSTSDGKIYIWDADDQAILRTFTDHDVSVQRLVWNSTLNLIASGDDSGRILVWNPTNGETIAELKGHSGAIRDLDWRVDGGQLASTAADHTVRTWEWPSGNMQIVENNLSIWSLAYSLDGSQLAYGGELSDTQDIASQVIIRSSLSSTPTSISTATP